MPSIVLFHLQISHSDLLSLWLRTSSGDNVAAIRCRFRIELLPKQRTPQSKHASLLIIFVVIWFWFGMIDFYSFFLFQSEFYESVRSSYKYVIERISTIYTYFLRQEYLELKKRAKRCLQRIPTDSCYSELSEIDNHDSSSRESRELPPWLLRKWKAETIRWELFNFHLLHKSSAYYHIPKVDLSESFLRQGAPYRDRKHLNK